MPGPNVAVVGAGAVGCYYGGMLARAGTRVTLIGRARHVEAINRNGLLFKSGDVEERISIAATTDMAVLGGARLVLFCVKSLDTDEAARAMAPHLAHDAVVLSLQNGVDNVERIRSYVKNQVMPVIVYTAVQMPAAGRLEHTGGGSLVIGQTDWTPRRIANVRMTGGPSITVGLRDESGPGTVVELFEEQGAPYGWKGSA